MNSLEKMVESAMIRILRARVNDVLWLPYEHEIADNEMTAIGIVKMERGAPITECFHRSDLVLHVIGAPDATHRQIDEAVGSRYDLADDLEREEAGISIRNVVGWAVARSNDNNIYARTWSTEIEVAYQQQ
jgi:hypothetical protein